MTEISRRTALGLGAAVLAAPRALGAQTPTAIKVGLQANEATVQAFYAERAGIFARNGLAVDLERFTGGAVVAAAISGGTLQIGAANTLSVATAISRGLPFVAVAPGVVTDTVHPVANLVVASAGPIRTAKDLNGKTVSCDSIGSISHLAVLAWVDKNGGDAKSLTVIELTPSAASTAIKQDRIVGSILTEPYLSEFQTQGMRTIGKIFDAIAPRWLATLWIATSTWANANAGAVRSFAASVAEGTVWARANNDRAVALLGEWTHTPAEHLRYEMGTTLDPALIQPLLDTATHYGFLKQQLKAADIIWRSKA